MKDIQIMDEVKSLADENLQELIAIRHDIHRHPELGRTEKRTSKLIKDKLQEYGVKEIMTPCSTAVIGLIHGEKDNGRCIAIRADMDGLPLIEQTNLPFASENKGVMHACGHDMHTTMLLGVAKILCQMRDKFDGTVKLIFQHSEDTLPGGAKELVENGVMENPKVNAILGLHVLPDKSLAGPIGIKAGPLATSVDLYNFTIHGRGGHGSAPHTTDDPILAAAQTIVLLQQIVSRKTDPLETVIFSIGNINGGDSVNSIPDEVKFAGVLRTYSESVRDEANKQVEKISKGMESISGCQINVEHGKYYPAVFNDPQLEAFARNTLINFMGEENVIDLAKPMSFSEDFSYYIQDTEVPGLFLFLYAGCEGELVSLHNPKIILKEEVMSNGVTALCDVAIAFLMHA